ncbi:MAG: hypothetical protein GY906_36960 [bacterium]|nr:hypothetical protein [bacterium]
MEHEETPAIRSIRGWILGNPTTMVERRAQREEGGDCDCTYRKPYLHSLVLSGVCWTSAVVNNTDEFLEENTRESNIAGGWAGLSQPCRLKGGCSRKSCYAGDAIYGSLSLQKRRKVTSTWAGTGFWKSPTGGLLVPEGIHDPEAICPVGGIYSYKPESIHRMGNWESVGALGVLSLFGTVMEHERGYRSDICRIDKLWILRAENLRFSFERIQSFYERTYECPVKILKAGVSDSFVTWLKKEKIEKLIEEGI